LHFEDTFFFLASETGKKPTEAFMLHKCYFSLFNILFRKMKNQEKYVIFKVQKI